MNNHRKRIYLDYSATTPLDPDVLEAMKPYFSDLFGNASSVHSFGRESKVPLEESRQTVAQVIGAQPGEVFFTSGGTEADNHALIGVATAARRKHSKNHLIISAIEHHAVIHTANYLQELGFQVTLLPVDENGMVNPDELRTSTTPSTCLISVMHANNEIGTIQPIREIADIAHEKGIVFHSDTVQSIGKIPVNVNELGIDLLAISAHKIYGPKGVGAIYIRRGVDIDSFVHGGGQERNRRAGTENVPLVVGFAKAMEKCSKEMDEYTVRMASLRARMLQKLEGRFEGILFNGHPMQSLANIVSISFDSTKTDVDGDALIMNMDLRGIAVTSGSACSSGSMETSHVLKALGRDEKTARATVRFSMGKHTTLEEIDDAVAILDAVVNKTATADA